MMDDLYQELILDHNRRPRNAGRLTSPVCSADGHNPLCGDQVTIDLTIEDGHVADIAFSGSGCAISTASASMMTEAVKGKSIEEVEALFESFRHLVTEDGDGAALGKLAAFAGVRKYPARVKCAILAWHTLKAALAGDGQAVSTE